ncbi:MAG: M56 family metallopeptidase, partial [Clostridiales bacterium]|nr:M56 family metallopeptidase [Clostridiales bacterium]
TLSLLLASAVSWHSLKRKLRTATLWKDNIYFSDAVKGPIVFGLFAPRIILPSNISQVCGDDDLRFIIAHENAHIKRLDHILKPLSLLALAAHWFNPLVWIAFFVSDIDREISCDEIVIAGAGRDIRGEYATSLVNANTSRRAVANPFAALAFGESNVNKRVSSICGFSPRKTIGSILLAVAAALIFVAVFMTGRASDQTPPGLEVPAFLANENIKAIASQVVPSASRDTGPMYSIEMATNANETQDAGPMHSTEMAPSAAASESAIGLDYAITQAILSLNSPSTQGSLAEGHVVLMVSETASSATVYLSYSAGEYSIENGDIAKLYKTEPAFGILKLQKAQNGGYSLESFQAETWSSLDPGYYDALKNKLPVDAYSKAVGIDASELERLEKAMATGILLGSR